MVLAVNYLVNFLLLICLFFFFPSPLPPPLSKTQANKEKKDSEDKE